LSDPGKKYSLDNYSNLTPDDIDNISEALGYDKRREILKFLVLESTQPDKAKTRNEIASKIGVAQQQAIDHCDKLMSIGVILEILAKDPDSKWGGNVKNTILSTKS
jgi:predicted transcriptional regulator